MRLLLALFLGCWPVGALAADFHCPSGQPTFLTPVRWSAMPMASGITIRIGVRNPSNKQIALVDADLFFVDALGRVVGGSAMALSADLQIFPQSSNIDGIDADNRFASLARENPLPPTPIICTRSVAYSDGSKQTF